MGFSLQGFIDELLSIIKSDVDKELKYDDLEDSILSGAKYAEECGQIKLNN